MWLEQFSHSDVWEHKSVITLFYLILMHTGETGGEGDKDQGQKEGGMGERKNPPPQPFPIYAYSTVFFPLKTSI